MFSGLLTKVLISSAALLYPGYASYKAISNKPVSQADLERWLMYWSILGCIGSIEYAAEWIVSWIPFYYSIKIIFLLYLLLPQTQGTIYVYKTHLEPFLKSYEADIDAWLTQYKAFMYKCVLNHFHTLWNLVATSLGHPTQAAQRTDANADGPPPLQTVASTLIDVLSGLCKLYGPTVLAIASAAGKQLAQSVRATAVSIAAQADAALAAQNDLSPAAENEPPKLAMPVPQTPAMYVPTMPVPEIPTMSQMTMPMPISEAFTPIPRQQEFPPASFPYIPLLAPQQDVPQVPPPAPMEASTVPPSFVQDTPVFKDSTEPPSAAHAQYAPEPTVQTQPIQIPQFNLWPNHIVAQS